jgi:hypothetical protein
VQKPGRFLSTFSFRKPVLLVFIWRNLLLDIIYIIHNLTFNNYNLTVPGTTPSIRQKTMCNHGMRTVAELPETRVDTLRSIIFLKK